MSLKAGAGRVGYRNTMRREAITCVLANALPQMIGNETRQPLWPSLENVLGTDSFKKTNVDTCWQTYLDLGPECVTELKSEAPRIKEHQRKGPLSST